MEYVNLFNKIFNSKKDFRKYTQIVAIILACKYFHLNFTFEKYRIEDITSKSNFEIEKHLAECKAQSSQFIILSKYIITNTTSKAFLNNTSFCSLLNR